MAGKPSGKGVRGARLNPQQTERTRLAIQTTQIVKRLNCFVLGQDDEAGNKVDLQPHQVSAALGLLRKVVPDLASIEGNMNVSISHEEVLGQLEQDAGLNSVTVESIHDAAYH